MSANIFGGRFVSVRKPAWHNIGTVFNTPIPTAAEAFTLADLNYRIDKLPMFARDGKKQVAFNNRFGLVREPTKDDPEPRDLAIVSGSYDVVQNEEIAKLIDDLGLTGRWPVETAGALGHGGEIFVVLDAGEDRVNGYESENFHSYFVVTDKRDGETAVRVMYTPVRVVCQNTLVMGVGAATRLQHISHTKNGIGGLQVELKDRLKLMAGMEQTQSTAIKLFNQLAERKLTKAEFRTMLAAAYPVPTKSIKAEMADVMGQAGSSASQLFGVPVSNDELSELSNWNQGSLDKASHIHAREVNRVEVLRESVVDLYGRFNDEQPEVAGTAWAAWQAIVENEDYRVGPESLFASALWGTRAKAKANAFAAAVELVTVR